MSKPFRVSLEYAEWAHGPGAEDRQPLALRIFEQPYRKGKYEITDPQLVAEVADVAELYIGGRDNDIRAAGYFHRAKHWLAERGLTIKGALSGEVSK